jgi:hypothetical protein
MVAVKAAGNFIKDPQRACVDYGDASVERGLLRRSSPQPA